MLLMRGAGRGGKNSQRVYVSVDDGGLPSLLRNIVRGLRMGVCERFWEGHAGVHDFV